MASSCLTTDPSADRGETGGLRANDGVGRSTAVHGMRPVYDTPCGTDSSVDASAEVWQPCAGWPPYRVSSRGRVLSLVSGKMLSGNVNESGYLCVRLSHNGINRLVYVHRLVAKAFLEPHKGGANHVNHRDFDKLNNTVANLEWVSARQNYDHAREGGRFSAKLRPEAVLAMRDRMRSGETTVAVARAFGVSVSTASCIKLGKRWARVTGASERAA